LGETPHHSSTPSIRSYVKYSMNFAGNKSLDMHLFWNRNAILSKCPIPVDRHRCKPFYAPPINPIAIPKPAMEGDPPLIGRNNRKCRTETVLLTLSVNPGPSSFCSPTVDDVTLRIESQRILHHFIKNYWITVDLVAHILSTPLYIPRSLVADPAPNTPPIHHHNPLLYTRLFVLNLGFQKS